MAVVLVVEDDRDTCESLARLLQRANHTAVCAADGQQAITALVEKKPHLVLLDLKLPEMDGISFLNVVRSYLRWTDLPVIVISGIADEQIHDKAMELGVKRVFTKTNLDLTELLDAVNKEIGEA